MLFKDIVDKVEFSEIKQRIEELYPEDAEHLEKFKKVLLTLKQLKSTKPERDCVLIIDYILEEEGENWHDVSGYNENESLLLALGFETWEEWLGIELHPDTEKNYTLQDILVHCLWEMTFYGWTQEEIKDYIENFYKQKEENEEIRFNAPKSFDDV